MVQDFIWSHDKPGSGVGNQDRKARSGEKRGQTTEVMCFFTLILIMADGGETNEHIPQGLICPAFECKITKAFTQLTDH